MQNKQESPAFNAEYIDRLLSGASADKVPEVPTEQPMKLPKKCRPTPKERPHRWILILTAILAVVLILKKKKKPSAAEALPANCSTWLCRI